MLRRNQNSLRILPYILPFSVLVCMVVYICTSLPKSALEYIPPGELVPYKHSAFRSVFLQPRMKAPIDTIINDAWRLKAENVGDIGDGQDFGQNFGDHGLYDKYENANSLNLKNGWQLASFRRQLAAAGVPSNVTGYLQRLGILSINDLDSLDTETAVNESAPAWEDELPAFADGAGGSNFIPDHLDDASLPQPQVQTASRGNRNTKTNLDSIHLNKTDNFHLVHEIGMPETIISTIT